VFGLCSGCVRAVWAPCPLATRARNTQKIKEHDIGEPVLFISHSSKTK
jgi:hypothetical protein